MEQFQVETSKIGNPLHPLCKTNNSCKIEILFIIYNYEYSTTLLIIPIPIVK